MRKHIKIHTGERLFHCSTCGRSFSQGFNLRRHEMIHFKKDGINEMIQSRKEETKHGSELQNTL